MEKMTWKENVANLESLLTNLSVRKTALVEIGSEEGFSSWAQWTSDVKSRDRCIYFVGNGASASMASHFSADMAKNYRVRTSVPTDLSLITALSNDICYEEVFAEPLRWFMKERDMIVAISSSGNSPNIVRAVELTKSLGGIAVTLSAMSEDNKIRKMGDLNFYVPAQTYGLAETAHAAILHYWMDLMERSKQ
jgi:D-sedoheptulose 7-phosphate isomerase